MIDKEQLVREVLDFLANISQQQPAKASDSGALGFCDPPAGGGNAIYIDDEKGKFYIVHEDRPKDEQREHIEKKALTCRIQGFRFITKDYEGDESLKLRMDVLAHQPLMIEKTLTTNFTRGLLFSLARLGTAVKNVVTIEIVVPPNLEKKTCFCNVYDSQGQRVTQQSKYVSPEELEEIQVASDALAEIIKARKPLSKKQYQEREALQSQEEELLTGIVERINKALQ